MCVLGVEFKKPYHLRPEALHFKPRRGHGHRHQQTSAENLGNRPQEHDAGPRLAPLRQWSWHQCQQLGNLLGVTGGIGSDAATETVYGRTQPVQLLVVNDEEPIVEVVGVGDGEALVLTVELRDFGRRRLAAILAY